MPNTSPLPLECRPPFSLSSQAGDATALDHAVRLIYQVCCLAGSTTLISESRKPGSGLGASIRRRDTPALFDAFLSALSYQGISNYVADRYMEDHGRATWHDLQD